MYPDWIDFAITFLISFASLLLVTQLLLRLLLHIARRTSSEFDEAFLRSIRLHILLALVISLEIATNRQVSLPPAVAQVLDGILYAASVLILAVIFWKLVDQAVLWYLDLARKAGKSAPKEAALQLIQRTGHIIVLSASALLIMDRFGINITALLATLGIGGLAVSLAAQDTLSNMVSGVMLVIDQPFRIGDRVEIQGLNTWGEVVDIGLRSTRIRTGDNRMVIVPNSTISRNFVINYTYPESRYREQINIQVKYGADPRILREVITRAVRSVEGVLADQPVDVIFMEFDEATLSLKVRWWTAAYSDARSDIDQVNEAVYLALKEAKIETTESGSELNQIQPAAEG
jgi:small-conductance mechanosensitive channel